MGGSLNHISKTERYAIERFGETVKSRLSEYHKRQNGLTFFIGDP